MRLMILSVGAMPEERALDDAAFVLERGGQVTLVVTRLAATPAIDPRIEVLELAAHEAAGRGTPLGRAVPCQIARLPRLITPRRIVFGREQVTHNRSQPERTASAGHPAGSGGGHPNVGQRLRTALYRPLRTALLSGVAVRHLVRDVEPNLFDVVVAADRPSIAPAWHLARRAQRPQVGYQLSRESWRGS